LGVHNGDPNRIDCNLQFEPQDVSKYNSPYPFVVAYPLVVGQSVSNVHLKGSLWTVGSVPHYLFIVLGYEDEPHKVIYGGVYVDQNYPGIPFEASTGVTAPTKAGNIRLYGVVAPAASYLEALDYYRNNPDKRFLITTWVCIDHIELGQQRGNVKKIPVTSPYTIIKKGQFVRFEAELSEGLKNPDKFAYAITFAAVHPAGCSPGYTGLWATTYYFACISTGKVVSEMQACYDFAAEELIGPDVVNPQIYLLEPTPAVNWLPLIGFAALSTVGLAAAYWSWRRRRA
jgi:hypothetical protein